MPPLMQPTCMTSQQYRNCRRMPAWGLGTSMQLKHEELQAFNESLSGLSWPQTGPVSAVQDLDAASKLAGASKVMKLPKLCSDLFEQF